MVRTSNTEMKSFLEDLREDVTQIRIQSAKTEEHLKNMNGKLIYVNDYVTNACPERHKEIDKFMYKILGASAIAMICIQIVIQLYLR
jgi:hypothetical protein